MTKPTIHRLIEFSRLLQQFGDIERVIHIKRRDAHVAENDVEHSYNLALTAWFLAEYFPGLNRDKVIRLALAHDLVEVHAGDTYIFADDAALASKAQRERDAQAQLQREWPDFPELHDAIAEYETRKSPEAKFVYALDKIMPVITNIVNEGYTWQAEKITLEKLHHNKQDKVKVAPEVAEYYDQLYELLLKNQHLFGET